MDTLTVTQPDHYEVSILMADQTCRLYRVVAADEDAAIECVIAILAEKREQHGTLSLTQQITAKRDGVQGVLRVTHRQENRTRYEVAS